MKPVLPHVSTFDIHKLPWIVDDIQSSVDESLSLFPIVVTPGKFSDVVDTKRKQFIFNNLGLHDTSYFLQIIIDQP